MGSFQIATLYLFDNVFFPNTVIPLIISDAPSRKLINNCYTQDQPVALWFQHQNAKPIATMGKIISIEEKGKGELRVIVKGIRRVFLEKIIQQIPYPICTYTHYQDNDHGLIQSASKLESFYEILEDWLSKHISVKNDLKNFMMELDTPHKLIDHLSLLLIRDPELKQILLETNSLADRIQLLESLIKSPFEKEDAMASMAIKRFEKMAMSGGMKN